MFSAIPARTWVVFAAALALYVVSSGFVQPTPYDNYSWLADAWLHGRVWVYPPGSAIDALKFGEHYYIIEAPLPAVFLLPLAALFGTGANQTLPAVLCAAVTVAALDLTLGRMRIAEPFRTAVTAFAAAGSVIWWCASFPAVWMFAHIAGAMFLALLLAEWYGNRRPWMMGALIACAALSRFPIVLVAIPFAWWLWTETPPEQRLRNLAGMAAGAAPFFLLYAAYDVARWGTPFDIGYTMWYHQDQVGQPTGSPFQLQYLPFNLYSFFMLPPQYHSAFPWLQPTGFGVALTFTSPALLLALGAVRSRETIALASAAALVAVPSLLYYVNGFEQFGMRHAMDFLPLLLALCARGAPRFPSAAAFGLIAFSIAANAYGEWYSWAYHAFTVVPR